MCPKYHPLTVERFDWGHSLRIAWAKVLCKVACALVKRLPSLRATGICNLLPRCEQEVDQLLATLAVGDLWGVGKAWATKLERKGILTARDLKAADHLWIRHWLGVGAERIVLELREVSCIPWRRFKNPDRR